MNENLFEQYIFEVLKIHLNTDWAESDLRIHLVKLKII